MFKAYLKDETGATAIEYGLIAALIAVAMISGATALGKGMEDIYSKVHTSME